MRAAVVKNSTTRMSQASACYELLQVLSSRSFPAVVSKPEDIHKVLALRSAGLIEAETSMPVSVGNGVRRIEKAEVTAITPAGRATLQRAFAMPRWVR